MRRLRGTATVVALAALAVGCSSDDSRSRREQRPTATPKEATASAVRDLISPGMLAKLDAFMDKVDFVDRVGPEFDLTRVRYTSRSDAVAEFHHQGADSDNDGIVIATTDDNWAHAPPSHPMGRR